LFYFWTIFLFHILLQIIRKNCLSPLKIKKNDIFHQFLLPTWPLNDFDNIYFSPLAKCVYSIETFDWRRNKWHHVVHEKNGFYSLFVCSIFILFVRSIYILFVCSIFFLFVRSIYISISWSSYDRMKATPTFFCVFNSCWECNFCCRCGTKSFSCLFWWLVGIKKSCFWSPSTYCLGKQTFWKQTNFFGGTLLEK